VNQIEEVIVEVLRIVLAWPLCFLVVMLVYKRDIASLIGSLASLLPGTKIKLTIVGGTSFEIPIPVLEQSLTDSLGGKKLSSDQITLLTKLHDEGTSPLEHSSEHINNVVRPLRDSALLKVSGGGFLESGNEYAKEIEITTLGRYVIEAEIKKSS
jgi:hypothetical protein